jgi:hypothetical protein
LGEAIFLLTIRDVKSTSLVIVSVYSPVNPTLNF